MGGYRILGQGRNKKEQRSDPGHGFWRECMFGKTEKEILEM
jgi:hypothetical protein